MARTVWHRAEDQAAYTLGQQAATRKAPRTPPDHLLSYNERAAFNDGWDSLARDKPARPKPKQGNPQ